jgi:hypothetical protein
MVPPDSVLHSGRSNQAQSVSQSVSQKAPRWQYAQNCTVWTHQHAVKE